MEASVSPAPIRAILDTSVLVPRRLREDLQLAAQTGLYQAIWSPWIVYELTHVLTWKWLAEPRGTRRRGDLSESNRHRCAAAARTMMELLLATFELVNPRPPYPPAWETLKDQWDAPIWAAAQASGAQYVVSDNTSDYPPRHDGRAVFEGVEYVRGRTFLTMLYGPIQDD
jgi:hypothetical protein